MLQNSKKEPKFILVDPNLGKENKTNPEVEKNSSLLFKPDNLVNKPSLFRMKGKELQS